MNSLRLSLKDAAAYSLMVGSGEAYLAAFILALGFSPVSAGLITTVPVVVGSTIQLLFMWVYKYISSYRRWVMQCARFQALTLFFLSSIPFWAPKKLISVYIVTSLYWAFSFSSGPAWNAWMGTLVPQRLRIRFFAQRTRQSQIFTYVGLFSAGFLLHFAEKYNLVVSCFSALLAFAGCARLASAHFISQQIERPIENAKNLMNTNTKFIRKFRESRIIIILVYFFLLQLGVYVAAPFFNPYMLKELHLDYTQYMFLSSTTFLARILLYPFIQKFADRFGPVKMMWAGTSVIIFTPLLWTYSHNYSFLIGLQIVSGVAWGMQELGTFLLLLDRFPSQERSQLLTVINFINSVGMLIGSLIGSTLMSQTEIHLKTYFMIFTVSTLIRASSALILPFLEDLPIRHHFAIFWRVVGLRPNLGAIMRPILYTDRKRKPIRRQEDNQQNK